MTLQNNKLHFCERCDRTIKHKGKCLPCNYLYKHKKYYPGLKENPNYDIQHNMNPEFVGRLIRTGWNKNRKTFEDDEIITPIGKQKIYSRFLAVEYKYTAICLFSLFIVLILLQMVAPDYTAIVILSLTVGCLFLTIASFKNYILWTNGAKGEERVIAELKKLSKDFIVINDLKLPNHEGNIDHLVLSKNGLFIIETKNQSGVISCNGDYWEHQTKGLFKIFQKQLNSPSKQVKTSIVKLREFLKQNINFTGKLWFDSIVVFSNENVTLNEIANTNVQVLKLEDLGDYIKNHRNVNLTQTELKSLEDLFGNLQAKEEDKVIIFKNLFKDIKKHIRFPTYWSYLKFGLLFGLFWLIFDEIFFYIFNDKFYYLPFDMIFAYLNSGLIAFLLGKLFLDILEIKIQSKIANLMLISLIGWSPFLLEFWIFIGFWDYLTTSIVYILARFGLIIPSILTFNLLKWRI